MLVACGPDHECGKSIYVEGDVSCEEATRRAVIGREVVAFYIGAEALASVPILVHRTEKMRDDDILFDGVFHPGSLYGWYSKGWWGKI